MDLTVLLVGMAYSNNLPQLAIDSLLVLDTTLAIATVAAFVLLLLVFLKYSLFKKNERESQAAQRR